MASVPTVMEVTLPASPRGAWPTLGSEPAEHSFRVAHFYPKVISYTSVLKEKKVTFHFLFLENLRGNKIHTTDFFFFLKKQAKCMRAER